MSDDLIAEALTEHWGPRCETKDTDDFPEMAGKTEGRCPCCLAWEQYDSLRAALTDERAHADALMDDVRQRLSYDAETFHDQGAWDREDACLAIMKRIDLHRARRQG